MLCSVITLIAVISLAWLAHAHAPQILAWIEQLGWLAPVLFVITYALATLFLLPTMVLTLAGGAIFGPFYGTIINLAGASVGAAGCFLITRHLIHDWFASIRNQKLHRWIGKVNDHGWQCVALLRLFPIIPFNLVNYGMGITDISFRTYLSVTIVFLIPAEILYTYFGYAGMDLLAGSSSGYTELIPALVVGGLLLVAVVKYVLKYKR